MFGYPGTRDEIVTPGIGPLKEPVGNIICIFLNVFFVYENSLPHPVNLACLKL